MNQDEWGWLLLVLLVLDLVISGLALAAISKHIKETTLRGTTRHRDDPYPGTTPGTTVRP